MKYATDVQQAQLCNILTLPSVALSMQIIWSIQLQSFRLVSNTETIERMGTYPSIYTCSIALSCDKCQCTVDKMQSIAGLV